VTFSLAGNIVDVAGRRVFGGIVHVADGRVARIEETGGRYETYLMPGFVDAHVHVESSMLVPSEFARLAVVHGTVATVSDPHEIGNVLGVRGVEYMIENGRSVPFKFNFGAPACVPATPFETAGATIGPADVERLLVRPEVRYLSEVMNFPGVIAGDPDMLAKIAVAKRLGKRIDGHAPGLRRGEALRKYLGAGIETDHECFTLEEAEEKVWLGCWILIREGSAARNFEALWPLIGTEVQKVMFCTDDMHPDTLIHGHIDRLVARAVSKGLDRMDVIRCASVNAVKHYGLDVGLLREGDPADFIEVEDLYDFRVRRTWIDGQLVAERGRSLLNPPKAPVINRFEATPKREAEFMMAGGSGPFNVIEAIDGQLITRKLKLPPDLVTPADGVLKIAVVNRYQNARPALGFIKGFGAMRGAIASSVAHDSHNIVAVGAEPSDVCRAVNAVIDARGGLAVVDGDRVEVLPLPVAGIMTNEDGYVTARRYAELDAMAKGMGTTLRAPFMTLSFMALLVIPSLKMSDRGLFDGDSFRFVGVAE
jgi:adenine deaminase